MGTVTSPPLSPTIPTAGTSPMPATGGYNASSLLPTQYPPNAPSPAPTMSPPPQQPSQQPLSNFSGIPTGGYNGGQSFVTSSPVQPQYSPPPQQNMSNFNGIPTGGYNQTQQQTPQFSQSEIDMIMQARQGYSPSSSSSSSSSYVTPERAKYEAEQAQIKLEESYMTQNMNAQIATTTNQTSALKSMTDSIKNMIPKRESPTFPTNDETETSTTSLKK